MDWMKTAGEGIASAGWENKIETMKLDRTAVSVRQMLARTAVFCVIQPVKLFFVLAIQPQKFGVSEGQKITRKGGGWI